MRADDRQRVDIARAHLAEVRQTGVEQLPPSRVLLEVAELRRQLEIVLGVLDVQDDPQLAQIRQILDAFDWESGDRQLALEAIERIVTGGEA
jgi:hypothetical protein